MEFDNLDSRPGKSWNFGPGHGKSWNFTVATPNFPIGCNRLQSIATDRDAWCVSKFWS